jgi:hypothetical protein
MAEMGAKRLYDGSTMDVGSRLDSGHPCERSDTASDDVVWPEAV